VNSTRLKFPTTLRSSLWMKSLRRSLQLISTALPPMSRSLGLWRDGYLETVPHVQGCSYSGDNYMIFSNLYW